jgi:hypothetical protein
MRQSAVIMLQVWPVNDIDWAYSRMDLQFNYFYGLGRAIIAISEAIRHSTLQHGVVMPELWPFC